MRADKQEKGFISAHDFADIMKTTKQHLLTPFVRDNLVVVSRLFKNRIEIVWHVSKAIPALAGYFEDKSNYISNFIIIRFRVS